jgi:hypothetical protein
VVWALALPLVVTRLPATRRSLWLLASVVGVVVLCVLTGVWNGVDLPTIAAGARSEFRFLPLMVVAMLSPRIREDARFYGRVLVTAAFAQAVIALLEAIGGNSVRAMFAPKYTLVVGGVVVDRLAPPLDTVFGTFSHRNLLGAFLAFAAIVAVSAGPKGLGLRPRTVILSWIVLASGTLATVSREGMIAMIVGTAFVLSFQYRLLAIRFFLIIAAVACLSVFALRPLNDSAPPTGMSSWSRWSDVISARGWSATPDGNFRLYYLLETTKLVAREKPVSGFGLGTASDPRVVRTGSGPLQRYSAGRFAVKWDFYNDGNWTVVLLETGFAGIVLFALVHWCLGWYGLRVASRGFWVGGALAGLVAATAVLGFFAPILQTRSAGFILWLFAGLAAGYPAAGKAAGAELRPEVEGRGRAFN